MIGYLEMDLVNEIYGHAECTMKLQKYDQIFDSCLRIKFPHMFVQESHTFAMFSAHAHIRTWRPLPDLFKQLCSMHASRHCVATSYIVLLSGQFFFSVFSASCVSHVAWKEMYNIHTDVFITHKGLVAGNQPPPSSSIPLLGKCCGFTPRCVNYYIVMKAHLGLF